MKTIRGFELIGVIVAVAMSAVAAPAAGTNDPAPAGIVAEQETGTDQAPATQGSETGPAATEPESSAEVAAEVTEAPAAALEEDAVAPDETVQSASEPESVAEEPAEAPAEPAVLPAEKPEASAQEPTAPVSELTAPEVAGPFRSAVSVGGSVAVNAGDHADRVVAIGGSAVIDGTAHDSVTAILGNAHVAGTVDGSVRVAIGDVVIDGTVQGDVACLLGDVRLGPQAKVMGRVNLAGGEILEASGASVAQGTEIVSWMSSIPGLNRDEFRAWIASALSRGRPLTLDRQTVWAWWVAGAVLLLYALVAVVFRKSTDRCVEMLNQRPAYTISTSIVALVLGPVVIGVLVMTVIGSVVVPVLGLVLGLAGIFGRVVILAWIGRRIAALVGGGGLHVALCVLVGGLLLSVLYLAPVAGGIAWILVEVLGIGAVVSALLASTEKRNVETRVDASEPDNDAGDAVAGFWLRLAASLIDALLVGALAWATGVWATLFVFFVVYCGVLWTWRQTTVGGAICGLKIVRTDGGPVGWVAGTVRALAGFISLAFAGLGFFWASIDRFGQSWHDKVAGTVVVRTRRGVSLV